MIIAARSKASEVESGAVEVVATALKMQIAISGKEPQLGLDLNPGGTQRLGRR